MPSNYPREPISDKLFWFASATVNIVYFAQRVETISFAICIMFAWKIVSAGSQFRKITIIMAAVSCSDTVAHNISICPFSSLVVLFSILARLSLCSLVLSYGMFSIIARATSPFTWVNCYSTVRLEYILLARSSFLQIDGDTKSSFVSANFRSGISFILVRSTKVITGS